MCVNRSENHVRNVVSENKATAGTYEFGSNSSNFDPKRISFLTKKLKIRIATSVVELVSLFVWP